MSVARPVRKVTGKRSKMLRTINNAARLMPLIFSKLCYTKSGLKELIANHLDELIESVKSLNKEYAKIKVKYDNIFRLIRNNASAHKNKDAIQLLDA